MITGKYYLIADPSWALLQFQEVRLECDTTLGPVEINLPAISTLAQSTNLKLFIVDATGNASANNITINSPIPDTFDDSTTTQLVLNNDGSSVSIQNVSANQWIALESVSGIQTYKVFTALLTQSGGENQEGISGTPLTIGRTYKIDVGGAPSGNWDFTNVGAPNNDIGTYFIATGTTANNWGTNIVLVYNTGAPVATVLENTIGNIWFTYTDIGQYGVTFSNPIIDFNKVTCNISNSLIGYSYGYVLNSDYPIILQNIDLNNLQYIDSCLSNTPIEIRVYN